MQKIDNSVEAVTEIINTLTEASMPIFEKTFERLLEYGIPEEEAAQVVATLVGASIEWAATWGAGDGGSIRRLGEHLREEASEFLATRNNVNVPSVPADYETVRVTLDEGASMPDEEPFQP